MYENTICTNYFMGKSTKIMSMKISGLTVLMSIWTIKVSKQFKLVNSLQFIQFIKLNSLQNLLIYSSTIIKALANPTHKDNQMRANGDTVC